MTREEKKAFLKARGWNTKYHEDYWVHPKTIIQKRSYQDYTYYGMSLDNAIKYEQEQGKNVAPSAFTS